MDAREQLFTERQRKLLARHDLWERVTGNGTISAAVMVLAALAAVACANTDAYEAIHHFLLEPITFGVGSFSVSMSVELFVNDFLMAIFFLLVGIELKYEMTVGELRRPRQALLPMLAAVGGVVVPASIYAFLNKGGALNGWAIPMATDIAFALGVLSLLGNRVPTGVRVFFSTLAIAAYRVARVRRAGDGGSLHAQQDAALPSSPLCGGRSRPVVLPVPVGRARHARRRHPRLCDSLAFGRPPEPPRGVAARLHARHGRPLRRRCAHPRPARLYARHAGRRAGNASPRRSCDWSA